jgi:hypothetical protein
MRFFVARVSLKDHQASGFSYLRPLQVHYATPKFMLPIRLGTLNADGQQELLVYALSTQGRVEPVNYRSLQLPPNAQLPAFVRDDFDGFYRAFFDEQTRKAGLAAVFVEWAGPAPVEGVTKWDVEGVPAFLGNRPRMTLEELRRMGVTWAGRERVNLTRLHFKYDREHFPEDLVLQETGDTRPQRVGFTVLHPR